jgi:hypothetical protein
MPSAVSVVALGGAKRPKLTKMRVSQKTSTNRKGVRIELPVCTSRSQ